MINYNLRVLLESSRTLDFLVQTGALRQVPEQVPGASGAVYAIGGQPPVILNHFQLRLGSHIISAQLFALPPEEYAGLLSASPEFSQFPVAHLLPALSGRMDAAAKQVWTTDLMSSLRAGGRVDNAPRLLLDRQVQPAQWHPEQTRLFKNDCGWFLSLVFSIPSILTVSGIQRSAAGLDVGLNTLAVAAHQSGLIYRAAGIQEVCITATQLDEQCAGKPQLQTEVERHLLLLQHAAARLELQNVVSMLLASASYVYWENLHYKDCSPSFKRRSRELGLRDFLMCWLPKRLDAAGIRWQRVPPDHTSQYCHMTHLKGLRDSADHRRFQSSSGDVVDADVNAARNIAAVGLGYRLGRGL